MPTTDEQEQTVTPQVQPQAQAVPDPAHVILSAAQADNTAKADAWEVYHNHEGKEFEDKLAATSLPQDAKAALWSAKTREAKTAQQPRVKMDDSSYSDAITHPLRSIGRAVEYWTRPSEEQTAAANQPEQPAPVTATQSTAPVLTPYKKPEPKSFWGTLGNALNLGHGGESLGPMSQKDMADVGKTRAEMSAAGSKFGRQAGAQVIPQADLLAGTLGSTEHPYTEEEARTKFPKITGALEGAGGAVGGVAADPLTWGLALTGGAEIPVLSKVAEAAFSAGMSKDTLNGIKQLRADWHKLNDEQRYERIGALGIEGLFAEESARHLGTSVVKGPDVQPTVSEHEAVPTFETEEQKQAHNNVAVLQKEADKAKTNLDTAQAKHDAHIASHEQGVGSPEKVTKELNRAKEAHDEATFHLEAAKDRVERLRAERKNPPVAPIPAPEVPTEAVTAKETAAPVLGKLGEPKTPPTVSPAHATTTIPQEPTAAPKVGYRTMQLPGGEPVGKQALLTEGSPIPKIKLPEAKPTPAPTDEGALRDLKATKGEVVESPEKKVGRLLQEALKGNTEPAKPAAEAPETRTEKRSEDRREPEGTLPEGQEERRKNERRVLQGINERTFNESAFGKSGEKGIDTDAYAKAMEQARKELGPDASVKEVMKRRDEIVNPEAKGKTGDIGAKARQTNPEPTRAETKKPKEVFYRGTNADEAAKIEESGKITPDAFSSGHITPDKATAEAYAKANGGKVYSVNSEDVPEKDLSHYRETGRGPITLSSEVPTVEHAGRPNIPKEEQGYAAKKEEVLPQGADVKRPTKSAEEYHPAVEQKVNELSDDNLRKLAKAHGLNPDEYDFNARDERRHRTERDQLAKDITAQMGEDEKINLGRAAEATEKQGLFQGADTSSKGRAARAEKMFPRLRGPVDENGNPKISGGAPSKAEDAIREIEEKFPVNPEKPGAGTEPKELASMKEGKPEATFTVSERDGKLRLKGIQSLNPGTGVGSRVLKSLTDIADKHNLAMELTASPYGDEATRLNSDQLKEWYSRNGFVPEEGTDPSRGYMVREPKRMVGTAEAAKSDTEHFANAKKELGPNASISDVAKRAQELKDESAKPRFKPVGYDEYAKAVKDNPQAATLTDPEAMKNNRAFSNGKGVYYSISPEGDLQGLVNNSGEKGAIAKAMPDAIAKGGKTLDAWDIYLPKQYEKYGFERTKSVPYDTKNYGEPPQNLKDAWKAQGWKEGDPYPSVQYMKLKETPRVNAKGSPIDEFGNPTVSGGAPEKKLPTGDELIKKYGESNGDPKDLTFILKDGRGVKNTGSIHDEMLGGRATDKNPPRERFIAEGNIRVRAHQGTAGREVSFSIPESGINEQQLKYIQKMSPMLKSGAVMIEVGKPGGAYKAIPYGEASPEQIETAVRGLGPVLNDKGSPIDWNGNPTVSGGSPSAGTGAAKVGKLPKLAEEHLTEEEKAGVTKTEAGRQKFVDNLKKLPSVQEFTDIAKAGEGGRKWYQRSAAAFDALTEEAPKYFKEGDRQKFTDFLAALSPQQSVKMNLGEALNTWTKYVDEGRPTGKELEKLLKDELTLSGSKIPNATKALAGEPLWPDLSKNSNFKVPSFAKNLNGYLNHVTNDGWQALFGGLDAKEISKANSYHPLAVVTRAAADALGWSPAEAQAAIWAFTKTFTEKGETLPEDVRRRSEDFADILALDPEIRQQLKQLGVNHEQLDAKLRAIGKKPAITSGASPSSEGSIRKLAARIEKARGAGTIPPPKSGNLNFDEDEETRFEPKDFSNEEPRLEKLGEKKHKSPYGKLGR